jgi:fatty acid desaturase
MAGETPLKTETPEVDLRELARDMSTLRTRVLRELGSEDYAHLKKVERWGRALTASGYATAWIAPNPVSMLLMGIGNFARWGGVTHPVLHRGYDRIEGVPSRHTSKGFAKGRRRFIDWLDWIVPEAWHHEHDVLHHYRLGEDADPDQVELNLEWLRQAKLPWFLKYAIVGMFAMIWKPAYYAPNTIKELRCELRRKSGDDTEPETMLDWRQWVPITPQGKELWAKSWVPYAGLKFLVIPALFAPLGLLAAANVWINSIGAEAIANILSFTVILPSHAGEDLPRFDTPVEGKGDFYLRQITGSVNYTSSGPVTDFLQGWLNFQIEHHLFPDLPLSQYRKLVPEIKQICEKHGIVYREESVFKRLKMTVDIMVGRTTMQRVHRASETHAELPRRVVPPEPTLELPAHSREAAVNAG